MNIDLLDIIKKQNGTISLRVTPKASANKIKIEESIIRVYITTVPEDGKANSAVIKLLAQELGIAPSKISILRGHTAKNKMVRIDQ